MIEEYLVTQTIRVVVSLLTSDMNQLTSIQNVWIFKYYEIPVIVVRTKADKIPWKMEQSNLIYH